MINAMKAQIELLEKQLRHDQDELEKIRKIMDDLKIDTNGPEGYGKRQSLSLSQHMEKVKILIDNLKELK